MIKNIIFDLGEVLFKGIKDTGLALLEKHKIEDLYNHEFGWARAKHPLLIPLVEEFFLGKVTEDEYIQNVLDQYPEIGQKEDLKEQIRRNFIEIEGTREIVIELKKNGYKTAILSVHGKEWIHYCEEKYDFHKLFDVIEYSFESQILKPNPGAFYNVLKKLNAKPEECLFIDDNIQNIEAAEKIGIPSILFTDAHALRNNLAKILESSNLKF